MGQRRCRWILPILVMSCITVIFKGYRPWYDNKNVRIIYKGTNNKIRQLSETVKTPWSALDETWNRKM